MPLSRLAGVVCALGATAAALSIPVRIVPRWTWAEWRLSSAPALLPKERVVGGQIVRAVSSGETASVVRIARARPLPLTAAEWSHLVDVSGRVRQLHLLALALTLVAVACGLIAGRDESTRRRSLQVAHRAMAVLSISVVVVVLVGAVFWAQSFDLMHRVLFPGGNFSFVAGSEVIHLFPGAYFRTTGLVVAMMVLVLAGGVLLGTRALLRAADRTP